MHFAADGSYGEGEFVQKQLKDVSTAFYTVTDEDTADLTELLDNITMARSFDKDLLDIIYEDASYYFNGTKSLDETVRIIENRVKIKLSE